MTTVRHATRKGPDVLPGDATASSRRLRRLEHRRLVREQVLTVVVLLLFLAVTMVLLGLQWLDAGTAASAAPAPLSLPTSPGGLT